MNKRKVKVATWNGVENNEQSVKSFMQGLLTVIVDVIVMFIFVWAARIILKDTFGVRSMKVSEIFGCIMVTAIVSGTMEFIDYYVSKGKALLKGGTLFAGLSVSFLYVWIFKDIERIIGGCVNFAALYIQKWNVYYKTSLNINVSDEGNISETMGFLIILLIIILVWLGKCRKWRLIFVIIPVLAIASGVVVGYAPNVTGCIMMLVGVLMANVLEFDRPDFALAVRERAKQIFSKKCAYVSLVSVGIIIGSMGVKSLVSSSVDDALKYSPDIKAIQKSILEDFSLSKILKTIGENLWNKDKGGEIISNMSLSFDDVTVLKMHTNKRPADKMYLKAFYGSEYKDGRWINDADEFEEAVTDEVILDLEYIKDTIAFLGIRAILLEASAESTSGEDTLKVKLEYLKTENDIAYIPYFAHEFTGVTIKGDVCFKKLKKKTSIEYTVWQDKIDYENFDGEDMLDFIEGWEIWYEQYVCDNYLEVPDDMEGVKEVASYLMSEGLRGVDLESGENVWRVRAADMVIDWFAENMTYTQSPPSLPRKTDPIEYFVERSKKGYCMHYASAATLMLREMGVPARYVSGYYVSPADFIATDNGYVGNIMDNAAHAWVEIYLDKIGWVPIEVTTSYADGINPNRDYDADVEVDTEDDTPNPDNDGDDNDEETSSETISSTEDKETTETSSVSETEDVTTGGAGYYGTNNDALRKNIVAKVIIISLIAIVVPAIIYGCIIASRRKEEKLRLLVEKGRTGRAIGEINRRIYVKLKKKGKLIGVKSSDMAYKEVLIKMYPQVTEEEWDKYMDIVREMAFSKNEGTVEDMEYCYEVYERVNKGGK